MPHDQFGSPRIIDTEGARPLVRLSFTDRQVDEGWLQRLLFEHPTLLPVAEIEPAFASPKSVAREVPTDAGPIDAIRVAAHRTTA